MQQPKPWRLYALHGFLGEPADWNALLPAQPDLDQVAIDLYDSDLPKPKEGLWSWAEAFNSYVKRELSLLTRSCRPLLMGYSLGGRLALHALCLDPKLWSGAILISSHGGLASLQEREERLASDESWAEAFLEEPWNQLMERWNSQSIFAGDSYAFLRSEENLSRQKLAETLRYWSLARQDELGPALEQLYLPILWVAGELDGSACQRARGLELRHPLSRIWIAPQTGHRVPWSYYPPFWQQMREFCDQIMNDCNEKET